MQTLTSLLSTVRVWLGFGDPSDERLSPDHGWLLPPASTTHATEPVDRVATPRT
jgi:hypothetical protein